jgi:hypothetical protein
VTSDRTPTRKRGAKSRVSRISESVVSDRAILSSLLTMPQTAWVLAATANSTRTPVGLGSTNLNLTAGAVVTFIILLLGLVAAILLMRRFQNPKNGTVGRS